MLYICKGPYSDVYEKLCFQKGQSYFLRTRNRPPLMALSAAFVHASPSFNILFQTPFLFVLSLSLSFSLSFSHSLPLPFVFVSPFVGPTKKSVQLESSAETNAISISWAAEEMINHFSYRRRRRSGWPE
jgi:hypothetical protein